MNGVTDDAAGGEAPLPIDSAEQRYRLLLEHSPYPMCVHANGRVVFVNSAGLRDIGASSPDQLVGRMITDFVHVDSIAPMLARIATLRHEGDSSTPSEAVMVRVDGSKIDAEAVSVLTSWNGQPAYQVIFRDLTPQKNAEATFRYQAALVEHVSDAIIATTLSGIVTSWNPAAETIYRRTAARALALPVSEAVGAPIDPAAIIAGGGVDHVTHRGADGSLVEVRIAVSAMDNGYVLLCSDQTALRRAEKLFQTVVDSLEDGVIVLDPDGVPTSVNPAGLRILGLQSNMALRDSVAKMLQFPICDTDGIRLRPDQRPDVTTKATGISVRNRVLGLDRPDNKRIWISVSCRLLNPADAQSSDMLISFTDITDQYNEHVLLTHRAHHDALTGLPNRAHVEAKVIQALTGGASDLTAVMFIDLDNMKAINDELGHQAGDAVIKTVAQRLRTALRSEDFVARLGGDEFVVLVFGRTDRDALEQLAARLHAELASPLHVVGTSCAVTASIGVTTVTTEDPREAAQILHDADTAMYVAKLRRDGTHFT